MVFKVLTKRYRIEKRFFQTSPSTPKQTRYLMHVESVDGDGEFVETLCAYSMTEKQLRDLKRGINDALGYDES